MPFVSRAQQGYMEAAKARGEIKPSVVKDFESATPEKGYSHLPEHVKHDAHGGLVCMHCGGVVDGDGYAEGGEVDESPYEEQYGGSEHDYDGDDDGTTAQSEETEYRRAKALFHDAIRRYR